jgi:hypothetical protein
MRLSSTVWITVAALFLVSAASAPDTEELLRQGGAAFQRGDYAGAVEWFQQAEARTTDPGLVAFDLAGAKYQLALAGEAGNRSQLLQEAANLYRCCTEPTDPRRARALLGMGNCLLQKTDGQDEKAAREAVAAFEECLRVGTADPELMADARHNLELAKLLVWQCQAATNQTQGQPPGSDNDTNPRRPDSPRPAPNPDERGPGQANPNGSPTPVKPDAGQTPVGTDAERPPGQGNLPPVPDQAEPMPLSPRDAAAHLEQAVARIQQERQAHRQKRSVRRPEPGVRDW